MYPGHVEGLIERDNQIKMAQKIFKHWKNIGPIVLSALSLLISFLIIQSFAFYLNPEINLLASKDFGKIAFTLMVFYQIILFLITENKSKETAMGPYGSMANNSKKSLFKNFYQTNIKFIFGTNWLPIFAILFILFFSFHAITFFFFKMIGLVFYNQNWQGLDLNTIFKILFGFVATFFLAWTEEAIFRGTIYPYFLQYYQILTSIFLTSFVFMIVHDLTNPISLLTTHWQLGLGLFLLGFLLNTVFAITGKLYASMGIHAGLVFVKIILRKAPFLIFASENLWPWWFNKDLRQASIVHLLFLITIIVLLSNYRKLLFPNKKSK